MKLSKVTDQYDSYRVELSYGQILAFRDTLKTAHATPEADELLKELDWYLEKLPKPGEEKEDVKDGEDAGLEGGGGPAGPVAPGEPGNIEDIDLDTELPLPDDEGPEGPEPDGEAELAPEDELDDVPA